MRRRDPRCSDELLGLAERLIAIESHKDAPGREAEVGRFLVEWFRDRGVEAKLEPVEDGRSNVVARVAGGSGSKLILNGHLDTVPAGDMEGAFAPRIEDGVLWGRGACDMKGAIASMACALVEIRRVRGGALLQGDLLFAGTVDEESGGLGVKALVDSGIAAGYAVVGEPTALRVAVAHKGACFVRVSLVGRGAHGSCPEQGVNAALYAARIVAAIEDGLRPALARRTHRLLGPSTVNVGRICGGTQANIVAERCEIDIDRRYLPGEASPLAEIREIVDAVCAGVEGLRCDIEEMPMTSIVPHVPLETSPRSRLAEGAIAACAELGLPPEPVGVTYWSDGGHLAARGIETVVLGPGAIADAHGPRDRVAVDELVAAVELYRRIATRLL